MKRFVFLLLGLIICKIGISQELRYFDYKNFHSVTIYGYFDIILEQSSEYRFVVTASEELFNFLSITQDSTKLNILLNEAPNIENNTEKPKIKISAPDFSELNFGGLVHVECENQLTNKDLDVAISGLARVELNVNVTNLFLDLQGGSHLLISGKANSGNFDLQGAALLNSTDLNCNEVKVSIAGLGKADVYAKNKLTIYIEGIGIVNYLGDPEIHEFLSQLAVVRQL